LSFIANLQQVFMMLKHLSNFTYLLKPYTRFLRHMSNLMTKTITVGAPGYTRQIGDHQASSMALLTRLRRVPVSRDMAEELSSLQDDLQDLSKQRDKLEDLATKLQYLRNEREKFEPRPNGGSFSPVRHKEVGDKELSLPQ